MLLGILRFVLLVGWLAPSSLLHAAETPHYGNVYFSLDIQNDQESNLPRLMMYLLNRYYIREGQSAPANENLPYLLSSDEARSITFYSAKRENTLSTLTSLAFEWNYQRASNLSEVSAHLKREDAKMEFLQLFLKVGDWVKIAGYGDMYLHKIIQKGPQKRFLFGNLQNEKFEFQVEEISHLHLPLTPAEAQ